MLKQQPFEHGTGDTAEGLYNTVANYVSNTSVEQMGEDGLRFIAGGLATAGIGKGAMVVGDAVGDATLATGRWLAEGEAAAVDTSRGFSPMIDSALSEDLTSEAAVGVKGGIPVVEGAIPSAERPVIDPNKITGYALDTTHPVGGNKAVVFDSALGYNQSNAGDLIAKIQEGVRTNPAVLGKADQFGQRFTVDMPITGANGNTVTMRTGWILDPGSTTPRLTTLYVK